MKRFLLWVLGVALATAVMLGAVTGVSWYFAARQALPDSTITFGGAALTPNGWCWRMPLIGAVFDRERASAPTLSVQQLGSVDSVHPAFAFPAWCTDAQLTITDAAGTAVFSGSAADYDAFAFSADGEYLVTLKAWHLPDGMAVGDFAAAGDGALVRDSGLETPARPVGWYSCRFRFTLSAAPSAALSAETVQQGGVLCITVTDVLGGSPPSADSDLGSVQFVSAGASSWRGYLGVAYNAESGAHKLTVTAGAATLEKDFKVLTKNYGTAAVAAGPADDDAAETEYRNAIWPLYTAAATAQRWTGTWVNPVTDYTAVTLDYGVLRTVDGKAAGKSNSTQFAAAEGSDIIAPAAGTVVFADTLRLTGNTVVIDHGCGVRTYLYGLASLGVRKGDEVAQGAVLGQAAAAVTLDVKIGSKSICPWDLFQGQSGLYTR